MILTLRDLIDENRDRLDDKTSPYLWSDKELLGYNNRAIEDLAKGAFLITDSTTSAVCQIALTLAAGASYTKSAKIIRVRECRLTGYSVPLTKVDLPWLQSRYSTWQSATAGRPWYFSEDLTTGKITFIPAPDANYTANLIVYRLPITELALATMAGVPEIPEGYHKYILDGVLAQAYMKQDAETFDRTLAMTHKKIFDANVEKAFRENMQSIYTSQTASPHRGFTG
mgnify:CR=1 FL=1